MLFHSLFSLTFTETRRTNKIKAYFVCSETRERVHSWHHGKNFWEGQICGPWSTF